MRHLLVDLRLRGGAVRQRVAGVAERSSGMTPGPALVRLAVTLAAASALLVAAPEAVSTFPAGGLMAAAAVSVGLFPGGRLVTVVAFGCVAAWLATTLGTGSVPLWRAGILAAALYLMHALAALAALLPYNAVVAPQAVLRWCRQVAGVLAASLGVALVGLGLMGSLAPVPTVIGPIAGSAVAAGLAGLLAWHLRRRWPPG